MSKISLKEAYNLLEALELKDVFASLVSNNILEDKSKLQTCINLTNKIYSAEIHFGINNYKHLINLLEKKEEYYRPCNAVFYYKHMISQEMKDSNEDIWNEIKEDITEIESKIDQISEHIFIEV